tara:strand:- start:850 stop:1743 length:894 start_codon:yes stop_codon:yes gene_type:complete
MSRFDRRLKGGGLRPGQSTCKIRNAPAKVMSSGFSNSQRIGGSNYATAYNQVIQPSTSQANFQSQQQSQQQQQPVNNIRMMNQEELSKKNRQLEQYALTAPSQEIRTMTMHEIRLNKLEWINAQAELMMDSEDNNGSDDNKDIDTKIATKLAQYTLTTLEPKLKLLSVNGNKNQNSSSDGDMSVKFRNLNTVSMRMQTDVNKLKDDVKLSKATIKTFGGNLQRVHMLQEELKKNKAELNEIRALYKSLKNDFEGYVRRNNSKKVDLTIDEVDKEKKQLDESDIRDVVVKAIKEKSVN